ncbi:DUF1800 family protein [Caulobacter segnis]
MPIWPQNPCTKQLLLVTVCFGRDGAERLQPRELLGHADADAVLRQARIGNNDQLRQRVAFALSQIVVASAVDVGNTAGLATFNQILLSNAFGNYRDILKAVTLNPVHWASIWTWPTPTRPSPTRTSRPRADAAVLGRHGPPQPRWHAPDRQYRRDNRHLQATPTSRTWPGP